MNEILELSESEKHRQIFSRLCHDAGLLQFQIRKMQSDLESLLIKIHNAQVDYQKAKMSETPEHSTEVTHHPV